VTWAFGKRSDRPRFLPSPFPFWIGGRLTIVGSGFFASNPIAAAAGGGAGGGAAAGGGAGAGAGAGGAGAGAGGDNRDIPRTA
jgi:hypothetical protein